MNIPVTFLEELEQQFCSNNEQDRQAPPAVARSSTYHRPEQFELSALGAEAPEAVELASETPPPVIEVSDVISPPPLANAKAPYYLNQKEKPVHRAMLHLAAKGYDVKEIAARVGRSAVCVNNILRQPMLQDTLVKEVSRVQGEDEQVVQVIKENVLDAVKCLAGIMRDKGAKGSDRISAANALLERRYGKANQPINRGTDVDLNKLSDKELAAMLPATSATATT